MSTKRSHIGGKEIGQGGYALITALVFFLAATTAVLAGLSDSVLREVRTIQLESASKQSYFTSESALEDSLYRIKTQRQIGSTASLSIGSSTATVTVSTLSDGTKDVVSSADQQTTERNTEGEINTGVLASFDYAVQGGIAGFDLTSNITGDAYTTGSIRGCSGCNITGQAIAAGKTSSTPDLSNNTPLPATHAITFGNSDATRDVAQTFTVSSTLSITGLQIYIKSTGAPTDAKVYIMDDNNGEPGHTILATGNLSASLVKPSYGWVDVTPSSNPILIQGTRYWIVIDNNTNPGGYYIIAANSSFSGEAKIGNTDLSTWFDTSPAGMSIYFQTSIGSNQSGITGASQYNNLSVGSAYAYNVSYVTSAGAMYCQNGLDNNVPCDTSRGDAPVLSYPVSDEMIDDWKNDAQNGGSSAGSVAVGNKGATMGPEEVTGNLTVSSGGTLSVAGTIWVTGNVTIDGGATIAPADPSSSYLIIADGAITITGGSHTTDGPGSHIMFISTGTGDPSITLDGGSSAAALFCENGGVTLERGSSAKSVAGLHVTVTDGSTVTYDPDMSQLDFLGSSSGSVGIKAWKEVQ